MGKMKGKKKSGPKGPPPPSSITLELFAPGMTALHRAGLGGLAATLRAMERRHKLGRLRESQLPEGPDLGGGFPWRIEPASVTLDWGEPTAAGDYLRRLFAFGFGIKDKLIDLPGTYRDELSRAVRAELQLGLTLTFLQHNKTHGLGTRCTHFFDPEGNGQQLVAIDFRPCDFYKHQAGADELVGKNGALKSQPQGIEGPLAPGAVVRHNAYPASTKMEETPELTLCLYFALVGCLSLPISRAVGVLLIPEFLSLLEFAQARPRMTPTSARHYRISSPGDAALQMAVRLRSHGIIGRFRLTAIQATRFQSVKWAKQQKSRVDTLRTLTETDESLRHFQVVLGCLPPRLKARQVKEGRGRDAGERTEWSWADSIVRPFVAENLARDRRWYDGFFNLEADGEVTHRSRYETKGLQAMADHRDLVDDDEIKLIRALHRATAIGLGRIYDEMGQPPKDQLGKYPETLTKRWERFRERAHLALVGAKTQSQTQAAISSILARAGVVSELQDPQALRQVKNLVFGDDWRRARDLALFALASYKKPPDANAVPEDTEGPALPDDDTEPDLQMEE